jgi:hypothetical protein
VACQNIASVDVADRAAAATNKKEWIHIKTRYQRTIFSFKIIYMLWIILAVSNYFNRSPGQSANWVLVITLGLLPFSLSFFTFYMLIF